LTAYYNEIDRFACDWLSNLMDAGLITPGKIDDRSIHDVGPDDLDGFQRVHFFAGIGGWDYSLNLAGWSGSVWTGSCPCQPFSLAGAQKGFDDTRHLWPEFKRLIAERRPATVFGEQVASATEWLRLVRSELEAMGYAVGAMPIEAAGAGANHLRDRFWFVAYSQGVGRRERWPEHEVRSWRVPAANDGGEIHMADTIRERGRGGNGERQDAAHAYASSESRDVGDASGSGAGRNCRRGIGAEAPSSSERQSDWDFADSAVLSSPDSEWAIGPDGKARPVKPGIRLLAHGVPNRVGLLRGFGNAIDPRPAAQFIAAARDAMTADVSLQHSPGGAHE
jgi:DNA (cytosine-5)-methyltransferase 1